MMWALGLLFFWFLSKVTCDLLHVNLLTEQNNHWRASITLVLVLMMVEDLLHGQRQTTHCYQWTTVILLLEERVGMLVLNQ